MSFSTMSNEQKFVKLAEYLNDDQKQEVFDQLRRFEKEGLANLLYTTQERIADEPARTPSRKTNLRGSQFHSWQRANQADIDAVEKAKRLSLKTAENETKERDDLQRAIRLSLETKRGNDELKQAIAASLETKKKKERETKRHTEKHKEEKKQKSSLPSGQRTPGSGILFHRPQHGRGRGRGYRGRYMRTPAGLVLRTSKRLTQPSPQGQGQGRGRGRGRGRGQAERPGVVLQRGSQFENLGPRQQQSICILASLECARFICENNHAPTANQMEDIYWKCRKSRIAGNRGVDLSTAVTELKLEPSLVPYFGQGITLFEGFCEHQFSAAIQLQNVLTQCLQKLQKRSFVGLCTNGSGYSVARPKNGYYYVVDTHDSKKTISIHGTVPDAVNFIMKKLEVGKNNRLITGFSDLTPEYAGAVGTTAIFFGRVTR